MLISQILNSRIERRSKLKAIYDCQSIIEFKMDGTIISANQHFLDAMGYRADEIVGRNHSLFIDPTEIYSSEYKEFWAALNRGEYQQKEFRRVGKNGREVWIQASYNPLIGANGKPFKVMKLATDITERKRQSVDYEGQIKAIDKSQAVVQFALDGTILTANHNFLNALGYRLDEVQGRHHSMFISPADRASAAYRDFWAALNRGEYQAAEYRRLGKDGREVWIQASYNPILDTAGKPCKIVKFATDITGLVHDRERRAALGRTIDTDLGLITQSISTASDQATRAAEASTRTAANVQAIAVGAEELVASVQEIARQAANASQATATSVVQVERANAIMTALVNAADSIGRVIRLITGIASQTNLLALNATIEAARAGDAGRGFAVVANEVKALANQTARATDEITAQIAQVQSATTEVVEAIGVITGTIGQINEISAAVAAAVDQQDAVAREISSNMQVAAEGIGTISRSMTDIAHAAASAEDATKKVKESSHILAS
jgi:methyl-accepting chemotaxis protein